MPRFDGTGPMGFGPGTGWGRGNCGGFGRGFGRYWRFGPQVPPKEEKEILKEEIEILEEDLKAIKKRLAELNG